MNPAKPKTENGDMWTSLIKWAVGAGSASVFVVALLWILVEYQMKPAQTRLDKQDERTEKLVGGLQSLLLSQVEVNKEIQQSVRKSTDTNVRFVEFMQHVNDQHTKQTELLTRADESRETLGQVVVNTHKIMADAAELMKDVPKQREEANRLLQELVDETKKKKQ